MTLLLILFVSAIIGIVERHFFLKRKNKEKTEMFFPTSEYAEHLTSKIHIFNVKEINEDIIEFAEDLTGENLEDITKDNKACIFEYVLYPDLDKESLKTKWQELVGKTDLSHIPKKIYCTSKEMQEYVFNEKVFCICGHLVFVNENYIWFTGMAMRKERDNGGRKQTKVIPVSPREEVYV